MSNEVIDAPDGPIGRWFVRVLEGNGKPDSDDGGLLGTDTPSPRLQGWLEQRGIAPDDACRAIKRTWLNRIAKRKKLNQRDALAPLIDAIHAMSPTARKREILRQVYDALTTPDYFDPDEDAYEIVAQIRAANILPNPLNWDTFEDWFRDIPADKF